MSGSSNIIHNACAAMQLVVGGKDSEKVNGARILKWEEVAVVAI